jgi:hypothetical protein
MISSFMLSILLWKKLSNAILRRVSVSYDVLDCRKIMTILWNESINACGSWAVAWQLFADYGFVMEDWSGSVVLRIAFHSLA